MFFEKIQILFKKNKEIQKVDELELFEYHAILYFGDPSSTFLPNLKFI